VLDLALGAGPPEVRASSENRHPDGTGRRRISTKGARVFEGTEWSPDGTRIALGGCAIAVVNADGSGYRELTGSGVSEGQPSWSPDGTKIVFARSSASCAGADFIGDSDLWTINPDGSGETRLTDGPWPDTLPLWQPVRP
jgi:TolB protein